MKEVIAELKLWRSEKGSPRTHRVAIKVPERDSDGDFSCSVFISSVGWKSVFGVDSFRALDNAFVYIRGCAEKWKKDKVNLFFDRRLTQAYDIDFLILHDHSRFLSKGNKS